MSDLQYRATSWGGVLNESVQWPNVVARCESVQTAGRIAALLNGLDPEQHAMRVVLDKIATDPHAREYGPLWAQQALDRMRDA